LFVDFFIRRPVFATVCALLIILSGAICIPNLPVAMYPTLAPPQVMVTCNYVGANADTVEKAVTIPLEESINGVEGMRYINSSSTNSGTSSITITFRTDYDLSIGAVDVQNRVASVQGRLPAAVNSTGITITKSRTNFVFGAGFFTGDGRYSNEFISNYLDVYVKDALKRVPGVGDVTIFGERKYAMRIWLDPVRLAAHSLTASDVINALSEQNVEIPAGQLGQPPSDAKQFFQVPVRVVGRLSDPAEFDNIIVKNSPTGLVLLKDVGHSVVGAEDYSTRLEFNGMTGVGIGVQQLSNANALDVDRLAKSTLVELSKRFPPGLQYRHRLRLHHRGRRLHPRSAGDARRSHLHRHPGHLSFPSGLARHHHSRRYDPGVADRNFCLHQDLRLLGQLAYSLRNHAGHRTGGRRRHRGDRERAAPHRHGAFRSVRGHFACHGRGYQRGDRHVAGADRGVCAGILLPRHHRHPLSAVLADHCVFHRHFGLQRA
jgi:uncharacterized protein YcgL (UPF0745 family)